MQFLDRYPLIVTPEKDACRDFWVAKLGFRVGFDSTWFVWLHSPDQSASIAFLTPDHPSAPPGHLPYAGQGITLEMQVPDAAAALTEVTARGLLPAYPLTDEPFGQRRFGFADPSGLWVNIVEQTEPAAGWWDRYR
jgi:catechol 2,3-dioxygenase-like lactoylglutathione lyase family enzyme